MPTTRREAMTLATLLALVSPFLALNQPTTPTRTFRGSALITAIPSDGGQAVAFGDVDLIRDGAGAWIARLDDVLCARLDAIEAHA